MAFRFITFLALVAAANAGFIPASYHAPLAYAAPAAFAAPAAYGAPTLAKIATPVLAKASEDSYDPHPQYSFNYEVQDSTTGDFKNQYETRDGDSVQGSYSLLESDGTRRTVDYTADDINGFNAVVRKEPAQLAVKSLAPIAKIATPTLAYGAPTIAKLATPVAATYAAPAYAPAYAKLATPALTYGAPTVAKFATPIAATYAAPIAKLASPALTYGAPAVAKLATPVAAYASHPYIAHVSYSTPLFSYSL